MALTEGPFLVLLEGHRNLDFDHLPVQMYSFPSLAKGIGNIKGGYMQICPLFLEHEAGISDCIEKLFQGYF